jgi:oxaloacetate decarboxylase alpha subunit
MTDQADELAQIERAARELVPQLTRRLERSGLGELEIRSGTLRVRVASARAASPEVNVTPVAHAADVAAEAGRQALDPARHPGMQAVTSPAVGFFGYAEALGPGLKVEKGDALGHVEMLGVRHDVRAPRRGTVSHLVSEAGEPVEYGQLLVELEASE